jgi:hypothetical protein
MRFFPHRFFLLLIHAMPLVYSHVTSVAQGSYPVIMSLYPFSFPVPKLVAVRGYNGSIFRAAQNTLKLTNGFQ